MFLNRLMNQSNGPLIERVLQFSAARHKLIAENMANVDTPGYRQKDLDEGQFFSMLRDRAAAKRTAPPGTTLFNDISLDVDHPTRGILYHDRNNRSMEQLASDQAKNGLLYTMAIELLKKQFNSMQQALKERVS